MHIQIPCSCQTVHVEVRLLREDGKPYLNVPMAKTAATELYETWTAAFALDDPDLYFYFFQITTKNESFRLLKQGDDTNMEDGDWWQISVSCNGTQLSIPNKYSASNTSGWKGRRPSERNFSSGRIRRD